MLSHRNITAFLFAFANHDVRFNEKDVYLSFLPLPHVFERVVVAAHVLVGSHVVYVFIYLDFTQEILQS